MYVILGLFAIVSLLCPVWSHYLVSEAGIRDGLGIGCLAQFFVMLFYSALKADYCAKDARAAVQKIQKGIYEPASCYGTYVLTPYGEVDIPPRAQGSRPSLNPVEDDEPLLSVFAGDDDDDDELFPFDLDDDDMFLAELEDVEEQIKLVDVEEQLRLEDIEPVKAEMHFDPGPRHVDFEKIVYPPGHENCRCTLCELDLPKPLDLTVREVGLAIITDRKIEGIDAYEWI